MRDRTFSYRQPLNLIVGLILIPMAAFITVGLFVGAARGEVTINGVPGDGRFQWFPATFAILVGVPFIVLGFLMLPSYFCERIVWKGGILSWYDRFGRLRVRSRIEDVYDVVREDTIFGTDAEDDRGIKIRFGEGSDRRRQRTLQKIVICTANGDISFYETAPWAEELESMARQVVLNKVPKRDMGKSWEGG